MNSSVPKSFCRTGGERRRNVTASCVLRAAESGDRETFGSDMTHVVATLTSAAQSYPAHSLWHYGHFIGDDDHGGIRIVD